jgi:CxxC motif-containing protein
VLLSVGLSPENELSRNAGVAIDAKTNGPVVYENMETAIPGIFACGNVAHVHDLVDFVSAEAMKAGKSAAMYAMKGDRVDARVINVRYGEGVGYVVPQKIRAANVDKKTEVFFRVTAIYKESRIEVKCGDDVIASFKREHLVPGEMEKITLLKDVLAKADGKEITVSVNSATRQKAFNATFRTDRPDGVVELICIGCPKGCHLSVDTKHGFAVTGHSCDKGETYGKQEVTNPTRVITSTVIIGGAELSRMPVKTDKPIPKEKIFDAMKLLDGIEVKHAFKCGEVVVKDICGTGANFISARTL